VDANDLYGLPLERFTAERDALAKDLRRKGQKDEAAAVAKLRKPSVAAWAVNQLVRTQRRAVAELFAAGDAAREAQSALLAGRGDGAALRDALIAERQAVRELVEVAQGLLSSEGHELSQAMLERVAETLHAAALEDDARAEVSEGCLTRELRHVGLGPTAAPARTSVKARAAAKPQSQAAELRKSEAAARRAAERAERDLETAQEKREAAARRLAEAEAALSDAQERAREARAAHQRAERALRQRR
jgi:hypothetical protein